MISKADFKQFVSRVWGNILDTALIQPLIQWGGCGALSRRFVGVHDYLHIGTICNHRVLHLPSF